MDEGMARDLDSVDTVLSRDKSTPPANFDERKQVDEKNPYAERVETLLYDNILPERTIAVALLAVAWEIKKVREALKGRP